MNPTHQEDRDMTKAPKRTQDTGRDIVHKLRNPPVMSMALSYKHLYRMMAATMDDAAREIEASRAADHAALREAADKLAEALQMADAALCGANMDMRAVRRKTDAALAAHKEATE